MPQTATQPRADEGQFRAWYAQMARQHDLNPNPDDPQQRYDYRAAFRAGARPDASGHWPSDFKKPGHPNMVVGGFNVQTGERVPGSPRAKDASELVGLGWDQQTAARLAAMPEPGGDDTLAQRVRAKYPGAYDDLSDQQLESAVTQKFPGVYDDLPRTAAVPMPAGATAGMLPQSTVGGKKTKAQQIAEMKSFVRQPAGENYGEPMDVVKGAGAGLMSTAIHGGDLIRRATGQERIVNDPSVRRLITPPQTPAGKVGFYGEQTAEYVVPGMAVSRATRALPAVKRMAADVAATMGVAGLQSGGDATTMGLAGAGAVVVPGLIKAGIGGVHAAQRAAAGAREGGPGGALAGLVRNVVPPAPRAMLVQALKPRNVKVNFEKSLDRAMPELKAAESVIGKPIGSVDDVLLATHAAKQGIQQQLGVARHGARGFVVDGSPVADAMEKAIPSKLRLENPAAAKQLTDGAQAYRRLFTLDEMETLLRETNAELHGLYQQLPGGQYRQLATNPGVMQLNTQARMFREGIDGTLDRWAEGAGPAAQELRRRYGALLDVEDVAYRRLNVAKRQQPDSLAEQIGAMHAAGDWARGLYKIARAGGGLLNPRLAIEGAADIASGSAKRQMSQFMKENQTSDALIRRAFQVYRQMPEPVVMPTPRPIRGTLGPGPIVTPPPADTSFVRGVPAVPSVSGRPRRLAAGEPPQEPRRVFTMPGEAQGGYVVPEGDPSGVRSVPAQPLAYDIDPGVAVKAGGVRVTQFAGDPNAARAAIASPDVQAMLRRMLADLDTFEPQRGRMVRGPGSVTRNTYVHGAAGSPVADDIAVISEQHVSNLAIKRAISDLLDGKMPTNRLHTAALDAATGYIEKRPGYRGPSIPADWVEPRNVSSVDDVAAAAAADDEGFAAFSQAVDELAEPEPAAAPPESGFRNVAQRMVNAEESFIGYAMESAGLSRAEAEAAMAYMRRGGKRAPLQIDPVGGQFTFTHGAFAEPEALRRAARLGAQKK